jgi:hypothetical protein
MPAKLVSQALKHVWTTLQGMNLPMAVMGGLALARWRHVRATQDVDLLIELPPDDIDVALAGLRVAGVHPKRTPSVVKLGSLSVVQLSYEAPETHLPIQIDLLLAESNYHREAIARRVSTQLPEMDFEVAVLTCEDLILHKLLAGRLIDRADAAALLRFNRDTIDLAYLLQWTGKLHLAPSFAEAWTEAFPGEPLPPPA